MWTLPWIKLSWHSSSVWNKLGWINSFWQLLCMGLFSFNQKGSCYSYAWGCGLCDRRTSFCIGHISRKIWRFLCFWLAILHSVPCFFFLYWSPSSTLCMVFDSILSSIDEVLLINTSILMKLIELVNSLIIFLSQTTLLRWLTFLLASLTDSHNLAVLDFFLSSDDNICSAMTHPPIWNSHHSHVSDCLGCLQCLCNLEQDASFHHICCHYSGGNWDTLWDHLRDVHWEFIFKFCASAAAC